MKKMVLGAVISIAMAVVGLVGLGAQASAQARSGCDDYAIMRCGATSPAQFITKAQQNAPGDLKAIYADYGLVPSEYGKFASTAKLGTIRDNGDIVVGGVVVGRSTQNVGRVRDANFNQKVSINGKNYWGGPFGSTYHANSADVMVMFNDQGVMQFAVISSCGNPQRIVPNKPNYACNDLKKKKVSKNTYSFTTNASAGRGAEIVKVVYDFGDGQTKTVSSPSQAVQHTFKKDSKVRVTVHVRVPGGNVVTTTGVDCVEEVKVEVTPPQNPEAYCSKLEGFMLDSATRTYRFTATAVTSGGAKFTGADFNFGDSAIMRGLQPNGNTVTVRHAYNKAGNYTITATLYFTTGNGKVGTSMCQTAISPQVDECKPGIPVGSPECEEQQEECVPSGGKGDECELVDTGPGTMIAGMFGAVTTAAGAGHYWFRRRKMAL